MPDKIEKDMDIERKVWKRAIELVENHYPLFFDYGIYEDRTELIEAIKRKIIIELKIEMEHAGKVPKK